MNMMVKGIIPAAAAMDNNRILFSQFYDFERPAQCTDAIALKCVIRGRELYSINREDYSVPEGNFLLIAPNSPYSTVLHKNQINEGICIYLDYQFLLKVHYARAYEDRVLLDNPYNIVSADVELMEGVYSAEHSSLGRLLTKLGKQAQINGGQITAFTEEDYYLIGEKLLESQNAIFERVDSIPAKKPWIRKELFKRVNIARNYIDDNLNAPLDIRRLSNIAQLSDYHFMRLFKQTFMQSPYQYVLNARLNKAYSLLKNKEMSITRTSEACGFIDIFSFSKAFKKKFGVSPRSVFREE